MPSPADGAGAPDTPRAAAGTRSTLAPTVTGGILAVVGDLLEDIVVWAGEERRDATDNAATVVRTRGGSAANVAAFASALVPTRFIGCVGADAAGDALVAVLARDGVDVRVQRRGRTGAVVLVVAADGERTMYPDRAAAADLDAVDPRWLDGVGWLHVPAYAVEREPLRSTAYALADAARSRGATVSVDASSVGLIAHLGVDAFTAELRALAPDVLFANRDEAEALGVPLARSDPGVDETGATGAPLAPVVVVKRGPAPAVVIVDGRRVAEVDAPDVEVVRDSTGAGDAFAAGFIAVALGGADAVTACRAGHALAASVLASPGASAAAEAVGEVNRG